MELSTRFASLFNPSPGDEVVPWTTDPHAVGFSVLRDYPSGGLFKPAYTKEGNQDSTVLIKIGYRLQNIDTKTQRASLLLSTTKASKYLLKNLNRYRYDFSTEDSPTEASLIESDASRQPVNLEDDSHFTFLITKREFWNDKTKKECTLNDIVEYAYKLHVETISDRFAARRFRFYLWLQAQSSKLLGRGIDWFEKTAGSFFRKSVSSDAKGAKFGLGTFSKYSSTDFKSENSSPITSSDVRSKEPNHTSIPGTDFKISKPAAVIASSFLLIVFYLHYRYQYDLMGLYNFMLAFQNQTVFTIVFMIVVFITAHVLWSVVSFPFRRLRNQKLSGFLFEFIFLPLWNRCITTRLSILNKKFKFDPSYLS